MSQNINANGTPSGIWARTRFDLEGIVGALAAWLVGVLLGWLWSPLFWFGAIVAVLILLATRYQKRVSPETADLVIAPCDGVVHSIEHSAIPAELRIGGGQRVRVRISSSPFATNPVYASMTGEISSLILEEPDSSVILAREPGLAGLAVANISVQSLGEKIGYRVVTGGFGPRLEMIAEAGDAVRAGRVIAKRRLGGWCDVYLPEGTSVGVQAGQTLIGGETVLCQLGNGEMHEGEMYEDEQTVSMQAEKVYAPIVGDAKADIEGTDQSSGSATEPEMASDTDLAESGSAPKKATPPTREALSDVDDNAFDDVDDLNDPEDAAAALFKKLKGQSDKPD